MSQFRNLVFEGGGVKGIAYVGALKVLEEKKITADIKRIGGTSAGAINAVLVGCGYTNAQQLQIMSSLDFRKFLDDDFGVARDTHRLLNEYGWYKGDFFRDWIGDLVKKKLGSRNVTFTEFAQATKRELYLMGANLSTGFGEVFSAEHTPTMRVVDAVRVSMSLPLFFASVRNPRNDVYVDGGLLNNYPIKLFDREKYVDEAERAAAARETAYYKAENKAFLKGAGGGRSPYVYNRQTLGFRLDSKREIAAFRYGNVEVANEIEDFFDFTKALFKTALNAQEMSHLHSDDWQRSIYIDTLGIGTTDFDLSKAKKTRLMKSGEDHANDYFKWFETAKGKDKPVNRV